MGPPRRSDRGEGEPKDASLESAVKAFLQASGIAILLKYPALAETWERVAGEDVARRARIVAFRNGALEIAVDSSALRNELEFRRASLLRALQQEVKRPFVSRLSFTMKTMQETDE